RIVQRLGREQGARAVGAAIIDEEDLVTFAEGVERLFELSIGLFEDLFLVEQRHDHAENRSGRRHGRRGAVQRREGGASALVAAAGVEEHNGSLWRRRCPARRGRWNFSSQKRSRRRPATRLPLTTPTDRE